MFQNQNWANYNVDTPMYGQATQPQGSWLSSLLGIGSTALGGPLAGGFLEYFGNKWFPPDMFMTDQASGSAADAAKKMYAEQIAAQNQWFGPQGKGTWNKAGEVGQANIANTVSGIENRGSVGYEPASATYEYARTGGAADRSLQAARQAFGTEKQLAQQRAGQALKNIDVVGGPAAARAGLTQSTLAATSPGLTEGLSRASQNIGQTALQGAEATGRSQASRFGQGMEGYKTALDMHSAQRTGMDTSAAINQGGNIASKGMEYVSDNPLAAVSKSMSAFGTGAGTMGLYENLVRGILGGNKSPQQGELMNNWGPMSWMNYNQYG